MTEAVRKAIENLRASTGPGGVAREDFLLLCTEVERQSDLIRRMEAAAVARGCAFTYYENGTFPILWMKPKDE